MGLRGKCPQVRNKAKDEQLKLEVPHRQQNAGQKLLEVLPWELSVSKSAGGVMAEIVAGAGTGERSWR